MWTLGIESTAHTLSFGLVDKDGIPFPSSSSTIRPEKGGIHPREAADHHKDCAAKLKEDKLLKRDQIINLINEKYPEIWGLYDVKDKYVE